MSSQPLTGPHSRHRRHKRKSPGIVQIFDRATLSAAAVAQVADLRPPTDGRLRTPSVELTLVGLGRLDLLGEGETAFVAASGERLVVAAFDAGTPDDAPSGGASASVVVDGRRVPLTEGARFPAAAVLVVSVPQDTKAVALEVLSAGRLHEVSLVNGARPPGASLAAYRDVPVTGQAGPISVDVPLSTGDSLRVSGAVTTSEISGWRPEDGYAPEGAAYLDLTVEDWVVQRPSGTASVDEVTVAWRLVLPDGQQVVVAPQDATDFSKALTFVVPVDLAAADLVADVTVAYSVEGVAATDTASSSPTRVELPA